MPDELKEAVVDLREEDALAITDRLLDAGADPLSIVASSKEAMDEIGRRFSCGEAFIPELIMAGEIMKGITARVKPRLAAFGDDGQRIRPVGQHPFRERQRLVHAKGDDGVLQLPRHLFPFRATAEWTL